MALIAARGTAPGRGRRRASAFEGDPAVFLDKDGTLVVDVPYDVDPDRVRLADEAGPALAALAAAGYRLVVVSNQPGVAYGYFDGAALLAVHRRVQDLLAPHGVRLDGFVWCPHAPRDGRPACPCRKPAPGLLLRASRQLGLDLARSWLVGDILDDVEAGRAAGCRTVLLDVGNETEWDLAIARLPDHVVADLPAAARRILRAASPLPPLATARGAR